METVSHSIPMLPLAPTLGTFGSHPRRTLDHLRERGFHHVQFSAQQPGLRPRDIDRSSRRDLLATLRRREMQPSGIDLWIPADHFSNPIHVDRAVHAMVAAIEMAADLGRVPLSTMLPRFDDAGTSAAAESITELIAAASHRGVPIADHALPVLDQPPGEFIGIGIDPALWLSAGLDPVSGVTTHADRLVAVRLCDLSVGGTRTVPGEPGGRLDVMAYKVGLSVAGFSRAVVLDARQWPEPWAGIERAQALWI